MLKLFLNSKKEIIWWEPVAWYEVIVDLNDNDIPVIDEVSGDIVAQSKSSQAKRIIDDIVLSKKCDEESILILKTVFSEKEIANMYKYIVNITTEDEKKKATIIESNVNDSVELDFDRWDRWFNTIEEAEAYAKTFNS